MFDVGHSNDECQNDLNVTLFDVEFSNVELFDIRYLNDEPQHVLKAVCQRNANVSKIICHMCCKALASYS